MGEETALLLCAARVLNAAGIRYFVAGSVASMHYGEPRFTRDIDIVVFLRLSDVPKLIEAFKEPEFYLEPSAIMPAIEHEGQFNVIQPATGMKIDFMCVENEGYGRVCFDRARRVEAADGVDVMFAAPEDVILKKLEYYREGGSDKHTRDITGMIKVSGETFDRVYLEAWVDRLNVRAEWDAVRARVGW